MIATSVFLVAGLMAVRISRRRPRLRRLFRVAALGLTGPCVKPPTPGATPPPHAQSHFLSVGPTRKERGCIAAAQRVKMVVFATVKDAADVVRVPSRVVVIGS